VAEFLKEILETKEENDLKVWPTANRAEELMCQSKLYFSIDSHRFWIDIFSKLGYCKR
jgi:hypothetical protein